MRSSRNISLIAFLALALSARGTEVIAPPESLAPVREQVVQAVEQGMVPSVSVAVIKDGAIIWLEAFGEADREKKIAATPDTPYPLTSCTKGLTAFAFLQLRERGLVDLDKPANAYLGEGTLRVAAGKAEDITPRRLLNHTAGFARYSSYYYAPVPPADAREVFAHFGKTALAPGAAFEYSNLGYAVAGAALEKAADAPWAQFVQDNVFKPLGMAHSAGAPPADAATLYVRDAADREQPMPPAASDHAAGTGAWASAVDAARFLQVLLNEGTLDGATVLKPESVRELFAAPKGMPQAGLGWFLGDFHGKKSFSHAGSMPGAMAEWRGFPEDKSGVVVVTNADGHSLTGEIVWAVAGALYPDAQDKDSEPREAPETDLATFQGEWSATLEHFSGNVSLTMLIEDEDTAYLRFEEGPMRRLQNFGLFGDEVGGYLWASFPARDDFHAPVKVLLALRKSGGKLAGTFTTAVEGLFELPTYVEFAPAVLAEPRDQPAEEQK